MNKEVIEKKEVIGKHVRKLWQQYRLVDEKIAIREAAPGQADTGIADLRRQRDAILANISEIRKKENNNG